MSNINKSFWNTIKYFKKDEFDCKCGCGLNYVDKNSVSRLDTARILAGVPFVLNSACRCIAHNKKVKGSETSSHLKGFAFDIAVDNTSHRFIILTSLLKVGFKRIGIYKNFIHVDGDLTKSQNVIWYK